MLDSDITIDFECLFIFNLFSLSVGTITHCILCVWSERGDAVHGQCSTVQTLYIFYYYIVVYIYCMHLSGQKSTCFMVFYCWLWKLKQTKKKSTVGYHSGFNYTFFLGKLEK